MSETLRLRTREDARANVVDALRLVLAPDEDDANIDRSEPIALDER
ncbi:MAG: hypothetical protein ACRDOS_03870 [Gaiellaceae bacterium]